MHHLILDLIFYKKEEENIYDLFNKILSNITLSSSTWVWLKLIAPKIINCEEIFCFEPARYENFVLFINDFSFESVIKSPPPKLSSLPLIITSPSLSPIVQGELDIIKALFIK